MLFASSEKVFYTIYGIEISLSPPIFEPVQLTLQTRIGFKYLSTLCFNMFLSIDRAVKKRGLRKARRLSSETSRETILKGQRGANLEIESKHIQDCDGKLGIPA